MSTAPPDEHWAGACAPARPMVSVFRSAYIVVVQSNPVSQQTGPRVIHRAPSLEVGLGREEEAEFTWYQVCHLTSRYEATAAALTHAQPAAAIRVGRRRGQLAQPWRRQRRPDYLFHQSMGCTCGTAAAMASQLLDIRQTSMMQFLFFFFFFRPVCSAAAPAVPMPLLGAAMAEVDGFESVCHAERI